jgi:hypothetical protein
VLEFCSGLVDLVVGVRHNLCGGHRLTLAGQRFVGCLTEDVAQVRDRGGDFGDPRCRERTEREPGDRGRRFVASELVEKSGEDGQSRYVAWGCVWLPGACGQMAWEPNLFRLPQLLGPLLQSGLLLVGRISGLTFQSLSAYAPTLP